MAKVSELYRGGNYLNAADVTEETRLKIVAADIEDLGDDGEKLALRFQSFEKVLIVNKTNAETLVKAFGDDTDGWIGKDIILYTTPTTMNRRRVMGLRVRVPLESDNAAEQINAE